MPEAPPGILAVLLLVIPEVMPYILEVWEEGRHASEVVDDDDKDIRTEGSHNPCIAFDAANIEGSS